MDGLEVWRRVLIALPGILIGLTVHEYMHARVAYALGDPTAKNAGRLTLNPIKHLDPIGSLVFLVTATRGMAFGWAKPVPINSSNFSNPRVDSVWVSLAGPLANLGVAFVFAMFWRFFAPETVGSDLELLFWQAFRMIVVINLVLMVFNLLPIPPLDGSHIVPLFLSRSAVQKWYKYEQYGIFVLLGVFFLAPGLISGPIRAVINFLTGLFGTPELGF